MRDVRIFNKKIVARLMSRHEELFGSSWPIMNEDGFEIEKHP